MTNPAAIRKIIRGNISDLLDVIQQEVVLLDESPLDRHAADRLRQYHAAFHAHLAEVCKLQMEYD